jgi:hypothetical protein
MSAAHGKRIAGAAIFSATPRTRNRRGELALNGWLDREMAKAQRLFENGCGAARRMTRAGNVEPGQCQIRFGAV